MRDPLPIERGDFHRYYAYSPAALAIRECVRLSAVRRIALDAPILDIGCGDGLFARLAYPDKQAWGIDINPDEVRRAQATAAYKTIICGNVCDVDFPRHFFKSAIANCSLEHVPDLDAALTNVRSALAPKGRLVLIVPTPDWTKHLLTAEVLRAVGLGAMSARYGAELDRVFSHVHLYDDATWTRRLELNGFKSVVVRPIFDRAAAWAFDAMLYPSALAYLTKRLSGRWILAPVLRTLTASAAHSLVQAIAAIAPSGGGYGEYLIECEKAD